MPGPGGELSAPLGATRAPHSLQNFTAGRSSVPQFAHARASAEPHSSQKFAVARFSWLQVGQQVIGQSHEQGTRHAAALPITV
jgi:hypothetical protein